MSLNDLQILTKEYPGFFGKPVTPGEIIGWLLLFILPFLIPYLYIRFFESRAVSFFRDRLSPFLRFRLHLEKLFHLIKRMLEFRVFRIPKL